MLVFSFFLVNLLKFTICSHGTRVLLEVLREELRRKVDPLRRRPNVELLRLKRLKPRSCRELSRSSSPSPSPTSLGFFFWKNTHRVFHGAEREKKLKKGQKQLYKKVKRTARTFKNSRDGMIYGWLSWFWPVFMASEDSNRGGILCGQVSDKANELAVDWNRTLLRIGWHSQICFLFRKRGYLVQVRKNYMDRCFVEVAKKSTKKVVAEAFLVTKGVAAADVHTFLVND